MVLRYMRVGPKVYVELRVICVSMHTWQMLHNNAKEPRGVHYEQNRPQTATLRYSTSEMEVI